MMRMKLRRKCASVTTAAELENDKELSAHSQKRRKITKKKKALPKPLPVLSSIPLLYTVKTFFTPKRQSQSFLRKN